LVLDLTDGLRNTRAGERIFEYPGEAVHLSIAESAGRLAVSAGSEGAFLPGNELVYFERTNGLPVKLLGCDGFFLSLDSEGNIAWHDNRNGRVLAVFSLHGDTWNLKLNNRELTGRLLRQQ
jgi:hypothetical protein